MQEFNRYEANPANHKDLSRLTEVPLDKVYDFVIKKHIVQDRQMATKLVSQQIGMANLGTKDMMCYEEFNRLFCKGMFKVALINTIAKLTEESASPTTLTQPNRGDISSKVQSELGQLVGEKIVAQVDELQYYAEDAQANFMKEMPLSLKIERYQRGKLMQGLKPKRDAVQKESLKYLQSLKFIQSYEEDTDELTETLRNRDYDTFRDDPTGHKLIERRAHEAKLAAID